MRAGGDGRKISGSGEPSGSRKCARSGRSELKRHRDALVAIAKKIAALRATIKKEVGEGAKPKEALKDHLDEAKVLAKEVLAEYAKHIETMAKIAEDEADAVVNRLAVRILRGPPERGRPPRPPRKGDRDEGGAKKENPDGENPFED